MAGTWDVQITVVNRDRKEVYVLATRTDGADVRTVRLDSLSVDTALKPLAEIRAGVVAQVRAELDAAIAAEAANAAMLAGWEAGLESDLDALETP